MAQRLHVLRAGKRAQFLSLGARVAKEKVTRGMRARLGLALPLVAALIAAGCGGLGSSNGSLCPAPTLEPVTTPGGSGAPVTSGFLIDRACTGDAKRSPSYPWPQLPMTALNTVAGALTNLDLRPGDSVFGTWISHNSNDMREIFLPLSQVPKSAAAEYPAAPTLPKAPLNQLECNDYTAKVRTYNAAAKEWQVKVNDIAQAAAAQDAQTVATFIERTQTAIRAASPVQDPVGTDIYGGLAVAGGVFGANPGKHKLVLFSDMLALPILLVTLLGIPSRVLVSSVAALLRVPAVFTRTEIDPALRRATPTAPYRLLRNLRDYFRPVLDRPARNLAGAAAGLFY